MAERMSPEQLAAIRQRARQATRSGWSGNCRSVHQDRADLLAEVERLIAVVYPTPEQMTGWERTAAQILADQDAGPLVTVLAEHLRDMGSALREAHAQAVASEDGRRRAEAERDRLRLAWESARRGRRETRAEITALSKWFAIVDDERDHYRERLAETDQGAVIIALEETVAAAEADRDRLAAELADYSQANTRMQQLNVWRTNERDRLAEQMAVVEEFAAERARYITSINNCHPDNSHDYWRWQGHAEGRRQLSEQLGLPVAWPAGYVEAADRRRVDAIEPAGEVDQP